MRVTVLGCGGSNGVPVIGNDWGACDPSNPRNRRTRPSILVENGGAAVLVDTTPDLRGQLLGAGVGRVDAVVYTHDHADHTHGIDDLRVLNWRTRKPIRVFAQARTLDSLRRRFAYIFEPHPHYRFAKPVLETTIVDGPFAVGDLEIQPFEQDHGGSPSLGLRFGPHFAYSTDVSRLDEAAFAALEGVDTWIVDCTQMQPHPTHAHLERTLEWIARVHPRRAYLTHMNNTLDYAELMRTLPRGVEPAYDGLVLEFPDE